MYQKFRSKSAQWLKEKDFWSQSFEHHSRDEISEREKKKHLPHQKYNKKNLKAVRAFRAYLEESNDYPDVWLKLFLNEALEGFWVGRSEAEE